MNIDIAECKYCVYQDTSVGGYESRCEYTTYCMKGGVPLKQCYYDSKCEKCSQYEKVSDDFIPGSNSFFTMAQIIDYMEKCGIPSHITADEMKQWLLLNEKLENFTRNLEDELHEINPDFQWNVWLKYVKNCSATLHIQQTEKDTGISGTSCQDHEYDYNIVIPANVISKKIPEIAKYVSAEMKKRIFGDQRKAVKDKIEYLNSMINVIKKELKKKKKELEELEK